jgi:hypothetical protein
LPDHLGMDRGRHTVTIELDASGGSPKGLIKVDGGRQAAFYGWIDLTARLEALMPEPVVSAAHSPERAGRAPRV